MPTFSLTLAPSVNALYRNLTHKGRAKTGRYQAWIKGELAYLVAQRAKPVKSPVAICIRLPFGTRGDPDNRIKATLDLLKRAGIIEDDSGKVVQRLSAEFAAVPTMQVSVDSL